MMRCCKIIDGKKQCGNKKKGEQEGWTCVRHRGPAEARRSPAAEAAEEETPDPLRHAYEESLRKVKLEAATLKRQIENLDTEPSQAEVRAAMEDYSSEQIPSEKRRGLKTVFEFEKVQLGNLVERAASMVTEVDEIPIPRGQIESHFIFGLLDIWAEVKDIQTRVEARLQRLKVYALELAIIRAIEDLSFNDEGLTPVSGLASDDDE